MRGKTEAETGAYNPILEQDGLAHVQEGLCRAYRPQEVNTGQDKDSDLRVFTGSITEGTGKWDQNFNVPHLQYVVPVYYDTLIT